MGSSFTCKLNPCCGDMRNCNPPPQYSDRYRDEPSASPAVAPVAVSVKGLEWQGSSQGAWARSVFGIYYVSVLTQLMPTRIIFRWKLTVEGVYSNEVFETEEAGKAAAQSDFNARILSSIIPATKGGEEEALRKLTMGAENFWDFIQGEYGVSLSSEDQDDHNVYEFFAALEDANACLAALSAQDTDGMAKP